MSGKPSIPVVATGKGDVDRAFAAIKKTLDEVTGSTRNSEKLDPLPADATLSDVIARLNVIVDRLQ